MKKTLVILGIVAFMGGMTSCKKDYTCTCTVSDNTGVTAATTATRTIENSSKKDAKDACEAGSSSVTTGTVTVTSKCVLD